MPTPSATLSTLQVGTYNSLTDAFTQVLDLNDRATYYIRPGGTTLTQPPKVYARSSNIRTQGERIEAWQYQNRHLTVALNLRASTTAGLVAACRALIAAIERPPYALRLALPGSTQFTYADVVAVKHTIPSDPQQILAGAIVKVEIDFECRPGLRGDRLTYDNLVSNPGFEAPSDPGFQAFGDAFSNADAYTVDLGGAPTVAGNVMTIPANGVVTFGSTAWGPIRTWLVRFQYATGLFACFDCHFTDDSNKLQFQVGSGSQGLYHYVGGVSHSLATPATAALTNGNWYWAEVILFPSAPGSQADIQAILYNDSGGTLGTQVAAVGPAPTYDAVTALTGKLALEAPGAALAVGGAFTNVNAVFLFGPGGWTLFPLSGAGTAYTPAAWEQNTVNTYGGGDVTSYGAMRFDLPPAGTVDTYVTSYTGSPVNGSTAIPIHAAGDTLALSAYVRSTGLAATTTISLRLQELDSGSGLLRETVMQTVTGNQAAWTKLSGTVTTGANAVYAVLVVEVIETTAGASANGIVWVDNAQCWNETTTGQTSMPYCETRFHQSPAQLLVTGVQGDMLAPASVALGGYVSSMAANYGAIAALGRRAQASRNAQLVGPSHGFYGTALSPQSTAALDANSYSGFYATTTVNPGWNPRGFSFAPADLLGVFHLVHRFYTAQSGANLGNVQTRIVTQQRTQPWYGLTTQADEIGEYDGLYVAAVLNSAVWSVVDSGQVVVPGFPVGSLSDLTQNYLTPRPQWEDLTAGGSTCRAGWQCLLPVDAETLIEQVINPSNTNVTPTNEWLWLYLDGLATQQGDAASATWSLESVALPNAAHAGGGPGTSSSGALNVNSQASPYLNLDPLVSCAGVAGVNQFAGYIAEGPYATTAADAQSLPLHAVIQYSPLYLYPR